MGWLDTVRESRRMRAAHAANAKELEAKIAAQKQAELEQKLAHEREIAEYLNSIIISSESVESYAARHDGGIAIIDVPDVQKCVKIHERRYCSRTTGEPMLERDMVLGNIDYLKKRGMFAVLGAQCQTAFTTSMGVDWSYKSMYYGLPVRRVQDGETKNVSVNSIDAIEVR